MNYRDREELKKEAIKLYLNGYNFSEIAKKFNFSRTFITELIKNDTKVKEKRNYTTLKVYKNQKNKKMRLGLSTTFLSEIGISSNCSIIDYVDVFLDKDNEQIIIKKHK